MPKFSYEEATSRNIGWVTEWEQQALRRKKVAIAGMGGVGGVHLLTLARLGIGSFHIADMDEFELVNFNRQVGATLATIGRSKVDVMLDMARDINPELAITTFPSGVGAENLDAFLDGVDLFVDGFDFFVLDIRAQVFHRAAQLGIPAITAAPIGMGTSYLIFMPGKMGFEEYFRLQGLPLNRQYVNFLVGLAPNSDYRAYLMDPSRLDLAQRRGPSTVIACQLAAGVVGTEALKLLLGRGGIRAAPWHHQFDAYLGKKTSTWVWRGNRHPLQTLRRRFGYSRLAKKDLRTPMVAVQTDMERILDLARWAPSGDNSQPWRFVLKDENTVLVQIRDQSDFDVYDYNQGQPSLLSAGMLLETMRIAASKFGRTISWRYLDTTGHDHGIEVKLSLSTGILPDPLLPYITARSVNRKAYQKIPLTEMDKQLLTDALGNDLVIDWHESQAERWRMAKLNGIATDIRLRIPEAFRIHQQVLDWRCDFSSEGIPAAAIGLDAVTLRIMRWALKDWRNTSRINALPGGTILARLQLDYLPGLACAAHFSVRLKAEPSAEDRVPTLLRSGEAWQRLWLTATKLGLVMQPGMALLIFSFYARHGIAFTELPAIRAKAEVLAARFADTTPTHPDLILYCGRIGQPKSRKIRARSIRKPLAQLMVQAAGEARKA